MSIENGSPDVSVETPKNTAESINTPITQTPENVRMVNNIDMQNPAEQALEVRDASANIKLEMAGAELESTLNSISPEEINEKMINNPEKAKSFFGGLSTALSVVGVVEKFKDAALNKGIEVAYPAIKKAMDFYDAHKKEIDLAKHIAIGAVGLGVAVKGAIGVDEHGSEILSRPEMMGVYKALAVVFAGLGTTFASAITYDRKKTRNA